jgi:hypothetical protein
MPFQDDERERELISLFQLQKPPASSRGGLDAELHLDNCVVPFEVKSSSKDSVTTVRDFGMDHVAKWRNKHWLFGFYTHNQLSYCLYGPPDAMKPWIEEKEKYIRPDIRLAEIVPPLLTQQVLTNVTGKSGNFTADDAKCLQKKQLSAAEYKGLTDGRDVISAAKMLDVIRQRVKYLILRGATLNNPHIPASHFRDWPKITHDHATTLRRLVTANLHR